MYKMKVASEREDEEFDLLLGEIPNATSAVNIQTSEPVISSSFQNLAAVPLSEQTMGKTLHSGALTDYYLASQSQKAGFNVVSRSPVSGSPVSSSSFPSFYNSLNMNNLYNHKTQKEGNLEGVKSTVKEQYEAPIQSIDQDSCRLHLESKLPNDQSLTSAFANLSFKSGSNISLMSESSLNYKGFPQPNFLVEGQYHDPMEKQQSNIEVVGDSLGQSPNNINSLNFGNSAFGGQRMLNVRGMSFPSVAGLGNGDNFSSEANREGNAKIFESNVNDANKRTFYEVMTNLGAQKHLPPIPSGPTALPPAIEAVQMLPRVPVSGVEFPAYQQQCYLDPQSFQFMQSQQYGHLNSMLFQQFNSNHVPWQNWDEDQYREMRQPFAFLQHLRNQGNMAHNHLQVASNGLAGSLIRNSFQPYYEIPASHTEHSKEAVYWNDSVIPQGFNQSNTFPMRSVCRYHAQGFCIKGENCFFVHEQNGSPRGVWSCPSNSFCMNDVRILEKEAKQISPEKLLTRSRGLNSLRSLKPRLTSGNTIPSFCHANSNGRVFSDGHYHRHPSALNSGSPPVGGRNSRGSLPDGCEGKSPRSRSHLRCASLDEIEGKIYTFAKDQHGCRYLQDISVKGTPDDVEKIFVEIIDYMVDLMKDPFGNYLVQKLLDVCNEDQKLHILHMITRTPGDLIQVSCNMHGTRSIQKVIETLKTPEQVMMVVSSLKDGVVKLMKDLNGNHVIQRCLHCLDSEYNEFLFDAAVAHCAEIGIHRHGCCVLQKCLQFSDGKRREQLVNAVTANALHLSQDPYGNYVVQLVLELQIEWAATPIIEKLQGHFVYLSTQKFGSNVVEKCLISGDEVQQALIIQELMDDSHFDQLLQDPYANYVVQIALHTSKGAVRAAFVEAIKPHLPALRSSHYGKNIVPCVNSKSK